GVGVEMAGAVFGGAAVDLALVVQRQAVVGDQVQVDGHGLAAAAQAARQLALQSAVYAALQLVGLGQGGEQGVVDSGVGGGVAQGRAGGGERRGPTGGVVPDGPE